MKQQVKGGSLRCKPGDLAIVTKCGVTERVGLLVRVIERRGDAGYDWLTELLGEGLVGRDVTTGRVGRCSFALMHDWNLTPINAEDLLSRECLREANSSGQRAGAFASGQ